MGPFAPHTEVEIAQLQSRSAQRTEGEEDKDEDEEEEEEIPMAIMKACRLSRSSKPPFPRSVTLSWCPHPPQGCAGGHTHAAP